MWLGCSSYTQASAFTSCGLLLRCAVHLSKAALLQRSVHGAGLHTEWERSLSTACKSFLCEGLLRHSCLNQVRDGPDQDRDAPLAPHSSQALLVPRHTGEDPPRVLDFALRCVLTYYTSCNLTCNKAGSAGGVRQSWSKQGHLLMYGPC